MIICVYMYVYVYVYVFVFVYVYVYVYGDDMVDNGIIMMIYWLVVWNIYWDYIFPTDFHMFQRGRYTTNQYSIIYM